MGFLWHISCRWPCCWELECTENGPVLQIMIQPYKEWSGLTDNCPTLQKMVLHYRYTVHCTALATRVWFQNKKVNDFLLLVSLAPIILAYSWICWTQLHFLLNQQTNNLTDSNHWPLHWHTRDMCTSQKLSSYLKIILHTQTNFRSIQ